MGSEEINYYSPTYGEARRRFLESAEAAGGEIRSHTLTPSGALGEKLAIDVAVVGPPHPERVVLVTSGIHGVEGFLGSAVQTSFLDKRRATSGWLPPGTALVFVHALNPYGFSYERRVNENNVDLNRNFLLPDQKFCGSPPQIFKAEWLNSPPPPTDTRLFLMIRAAILLLTHGRRKAGDFLTKGQFDFPRALFFGGQSHEESTRVVQAHVSEWTRRSPRILHLDFHTGLGRFGQCRLLGVENDKSPRARWLKSKFGDDRVEAVGKGVASESSLIGCMGRWLANHFRAEGCTYAYLVPEFGTYSGTHVFLALYRENRVFNFPDHPTYPRAKTELKEAFFPSNTQWRESCLLHGQNLIAQSLVAAQDSVWDI